MQINELDNFIQNYKQFKFKLTIEDLYELEN